MNTPTAAIVRSRTPRYDWSAVGYPAPTASDTDPLDEGVADAVEYVQGVTWRKLDDTMDPAFERRATRAVILRAQQQVQQEDPDLVETAAEGELVSSFSASGYSETRRAYSDFKAANDALLVNRWPALSDLLWAVMTPEAQAWWRAFLKGEMPGLPAAVALGGFSVVETAWDLVHAWPYEDTPPWLDSYRSTYLQPVDPGDLPYVPDPYGETW